MISDLARDGQPKPRKASQIAVLVGQSEPDLPARSGLSNRKAPPSRVSGEIRHVCGWRGASSPASIGGRGDWDSLGRDAIMYFRIIGTVSSVETIAAGAGVRERTRLRKLYGRGRWLKRKGVAEVRLASGELIRAELHWYECAGIGKREFKIKRILEGNQT